MKIIKKCQFEMDHIKPLSIGGNNEIINLQTLCKGCHNLKTRCEQEQGYFKMSDTESSFNTITKSIYDSSLCSTYAFIEKINEKSPKSYGSKIYNIDIKKSRKNILYYSNFSYPLFTVMDKPVIYNGQSQTGLYYVETISYMPVSYTHLTLPTIYSV